MNDLGALGVMMRWGGAMAVLLLVRPGLAQECQVDEDCGHGFQCIHDSAGTAVTGGVGGTASSAVCGDAICDFSSEDAESCPDDCDTIQYCAVAECSSDADCAEGYECGVEVGSNSGFTSAGGTSSSVCGDGVCDFDETNASCPDDCRLYRLCQAKQVACMSDDDCAKGFYCYLDSGANNVSVAVSSVDSTSGTDTATNGSDTATGSGGNVGSGSDGGQDTSAGFAPIPPADTGSDTAGSDMGVCLPNSSDGTTGGSSGSVNNVATVGGATTGGDTAGTDAGETGSSASSGNGSGGATSQNSSVVGSGTDSSSDGASSDGASNGGAGDGSSTGSGDGSGSDDDAGCSCAVAGAGGWSGGLLLALFGLVAVGGRRLTTRRR